MSLTIRAPDHAVPDSTVLVGGDRSATALTGAWWTKIAGGIEQRFRAINSFLDDVLTNAGVPSFLQRSPLARHALSRVSRTLLGLRPFGGCWTWLASTDLYVNSDQEAMILDHNLACPVGLHRLSELSSAVGATELVDGWVSRQLQPEVLHRRGTDNLTRVAVLDSGSFSPAFRETEYLANRANAKLVRNRDVQIDEEGLAIMQHGQRERIDLLIRRLDDELLDPNCFRPDSLVGVPGIVRACRDGRAAVLNSPGTGLMNHRAISTLIPDMIHHYLNESPLLRSVQTLICGHPDDCDVVLRHPEDFAVRTIDPLHPSRPFFGATASESERNQMTERLRNDPSGFVARRLLQEASSRLTGSHAQTLESAAAAAAPGGAPAEGFNLRVFAGLSDVFRMLPMGIGRTAQPDGGATVAIMSDPSTFLVHS